ncbi:MAG TPA: hypothetical protein VFO19_18890, partial [Vicinamibacterales bacterium]|nr:hypothetical protein [Vicinamibacterales bacterium]
PLPAAAVAFYVAPPPNVSPTSNGSDGHGGMLSPDGRHFAFSGVDRSTGEIAIYVRAMSVVDTRKIPGTEHGLYPFWSPNNRSIAFYAAGKLKRVDIDGQALQVICDARTGGWGGSWNAEDVIVAGLDDPGPLMKVSARGGTPEPATRLQVNEEDHDFPQFLPDQRHFLYTAWGNDAIGQGAAFVGSLDSTDQVLVRHDMSDPPSYSDPGQLVFIRKRTLMAQPFDLGTLKLQGEPVPLVTPARGPVVASASGALAYVTSASKSDRRVFWIDERGGDERAAMPAGYVADTAVSPDGSMVAYAKKDSETSTADIWIRDLASGGDRRLTFDPAEDVSPVWSPDSQTIVFASNRRGGTALYRKPASGAGEEAPISPATTASQLLVSQWHPTAGIVYYGGVPSWDLLLLGPDKTTTRLVATPASEGRGVISPDGRWLAYDARETSRFEIYVTTMPPSAGKWMATTQGGAEPRWSKDGKQLFYISSVTGALMAMDVSIAGTPAFGLPRRVHPGPIDWGWFSSHTYDVDPKTGRLLITVANQPGELTVLLNWRSLLAR